MKNSREGATQDPVGDVYDAVIGPVVARRGAEGWRGWTPGALAEPVYRYGGDARGHVEPGARPDAHAQAVPGARGQQRRRWSDEPGRRPPPDAARGHPGRRWNDAPPPSRARFASVAGSVGFFVPGKSPAAETAAAEAHVPSARTIELPAPPADAGLLPHWERAARIRRDMDVLRRLVAFGTAILDRLDMALLAVGPEGDVRFSNAAAAEYLGPGSPLQVAAGRLAAAMPDRQAALAAGIRNAARFGATAQFLLEDGTGRRRCWVLVAPLVPDATAPEEGLALLLLHDTDGAPPPAAEFMRTAFGATPAEARLADALAAGDTAEEFATVAKVSMNTVRTQIRGLLTKAGLNRQADLLRLLARLPRFRISRSRP